MHLLRETIYREDRVLCRGIGRRITHLRMGGDDRGSSASRGASKAVNCRPAKLYAVGRMAALGGLSDARRFAGLWF